MVRLRYFALLWLAAGLFSLSPQARAQGVRVFAMASGTYLFSENSFAVNSNPFQSNYAKGGKFIFGGEYMHWKLLGLEFAYATGHNNLRITDLKEIPPEEVGYGVGIQRFNANLAVHSPVELGRIRPYATAGIDFTRFGPTSDAKSLALTQGFAGQPAALENSNKPGINFGVGLDWKFMPALAVRLDLRNHFMGTPSFGLPTSSTIGAAFPVSGSAHNLEISIGVSLNIGIGQ